MPKLVSSFSVVPNYKIFSFLLLKVNDQKNRIIVLQCNTMKMCFMSTHHPSCIVHWFGVGFSLWTNYCNQPEGDEKYAESLICLIVTRFVGPCPHRDKDYHIQSNFWKFYLIRTSFTLGELVPLVKVFRLFRLEWIFLVFRVWTQ